MLPVGHVGRATRSRFFAGRVERVARTYAAGGIGTRVSLDREHLNAAIAGQPMVRLIALSPGKFVASEVDATVEFTLADSVPYAATLPLQQGNLVAEFKRDP